MLSATASLGLVLLWDVDSGLSEIDKYLYSTDEAVKVNLDIKSSRIVLLSLGWGSIGLWNSE